MGGNHGEKDNMHAMYQNGISHELTFFAGLDAVGPRVIKVQVAGIAAVISPSTVVSATTAFALFEGATHGAYGTGLCCDARH